MVGVRELEHMQIFGVFFLYFYRVTKKRLDVDEVGL